MTLGISEIVGIIGVMITISGIVSRIYQSLILAKVKEMMDQKNKTCEEHTRKTDKMDANYENLSKDLTEVKTLIREILKKQTELSEKIVRIETKLEDK